MVAFVSHRWTRIALGSICLALTWMIVGTSAQELIGSLNSDQLYVPSVAQELLGGEIAMDGWQLQPAPSFFPDMVLYTTLLGVIPDVGTATILYCLVFVSLLTLLMLGLAHAAGVRFSHALLGVLLLVVLLRLYAGEFDFYSPGHHGGSLLTGLALLNVGLLQLRAWSTLAAAVGFVLALAGTASDLIFVPYFAAPVVLALTLSWFEDRRRKAPLLSALVVGAGVAVGYGILLACRHVLLVPDQPVRPDLDVGSWFEVLRHLAAIAVDGQQSLVVLGMAIGWAAWRVGLDRGASAARGIEGARRKIALVVLACLAATLVAPLVAGHWSPRYAYPLLVIPPLALPLLLDLRSAIGLAALGATLGALVVGLSTERPALLRIPTAESVRLPYPEEARCIDELDEERPIDYGYAEYWSARRLSMHSRRGVHVLPVSSSGKPRSWITNHNWFDLAKRSTPEQLFVITRGLAPQAMNADLGLPTEVRTCGDLTLNIHSFNPSSRRDPGGRIDLP